MEIDIYIYFHMYIFFNSLTFVRSQGQTKLGILFCTKCKILNFMFISNIQFLKMTRRIKENNGPFLISHVHGAKSE